MNQILCVTSNFGSGGRSFAPLELYWVGPDQFKEYNPVVNSWSPAYSLEHWRNDRGYVRQWAGTATYAELSRVNQWA